VRIWKDEWKGKKHFRDCGCGASLDDGDNVVMSVSMPVKINRLIRKHADEYWLSMSQAVRELVELGAGYKELMK
jgi:hypothetical protein